jgi:hypothetical protein
VNLCVSLGLLDHNDTEEECPCVKMFRTSRLNLSACDVLCPLTTLAGEGKIRFMTKQSQITERNTGGGRGPGDRSKEAA